MLAETPFAAALRMLGERDLVQLFDGRVNRTTIANWKAGRRGPPQWAIDRILARWEERDQTTRATIAKIEKGPGLSVGARNLAIYREKISRERDE